MVEDFIPLTNPLRILRLQAVYHSVYLIPFCLVGGLVSTELTEAVLCRWSVGIMVKDCHRSDLVRTTAEQARTAVVRGFRETQATVSRRPETEIGLLLLISLRMVLQVLSEVVSTT